MAETLHDLVQRRLHRGECRQLLDERVAAGDGLLAEHRIAVVVEHWPAHDIAVVVAERLLQLDREGMGEELDDGLARRQVDGEVVPLRGRDLGDAPFHQRLAGGDELDDRRAAGCEIGLDRANEARALHGGQQVPEETLLRALEGAHCSRLGIAVQRRLVVDDAGRLQRFLDVLVDDLEGAGIGVVDAPLFRRQGVFENLDLDTVIGERAGLVETEGLQVPRDHLHRGDAARLHRRDEIGAGLEGRVAGGPQAEPSGVGEAGDGGGPGCRDIGYAGVGQRVLEPQAGAALLGRLDLAAIALGAGGVRHRVCLVEHDHPVEGVAVVLLHAAGQPFHDLVEPGLLALASRRAQRRVGREQDAFGNGNVRALAEVGDGKHVVLASAERGPVAARVLEQLVGLREPEGTGPAAEPVVEHDGGDLPSLPRTGAVAQHPAAAEADRGRQHLAVGGDGPGIVRIGVV